MDIHMAGSQSDPITTISVHELAEGIKMILHHFMNMNSTMMTSKRNNYSMVDVALLLIHDSYLLQVSYYGQWNRQQLDQLLKDFELFTRIDSMCDNVPIAYVTVRSHGSQTDMKFEVKGKRHLPARIHVLDNEVNRFPRFENYITIELQYRLLVHELPMLKKLLIYEFDVLRKSHPDVKFHFHCETEVIYVNQISSDEDFQNCQLLGSAMIDVMRHTLNVEVKERCFRILKVKRLADAQKMLEKSLFSLTFENYIIPNKKKSKGTPVSDHNSDCEE